jgi:hypothetical protein
METQYHQKWLESNPNYYKDYGIKNREKLNAYHRAYYAKNKAKMNAYNRAYYKGYLKQKKKTDLEAKVAKFKASLYILPIETV